MNPLLLGVMLALNEPPHCLINSMHMISNWCPSEQTVAALMADEWKVDIFKFKVLCASGHDKAHCIIVERATGKETPNAP